MKSPIPLFAFLAVFAFADGASAADKKPKPSPGAQSPLERYVSEAEARSAVAAPATPGSIWQTGSRLADAARDMRASQVDDVLTVVVAESASAVSTGATKTQRTSSAASSLASVPGIPKTASALTNLLNISGDQQLSGQGSTSRSASVVVEATKDIQINSEKQTITVRGVVRPADIDPTNSILSNRLADLEVRVNGKGVVADAIRRPFILYRILLGLLPF